MIYIDYQGSYGSFTGTLEGDNWKITSVTEHQISQEKFEVGSLLTTLTHLIYTVEISNEFGKSIKFDVDGGVTINGINPEYDSDYNDFFDMFYKLERKAKDKKILVKSITRIENKHV